MAIRLGVSLGLFLGSLTLGWWLHQRGLLSEHSASRLVQWLIRVLSPLVLGLSFWRMDLHRVEPWLLPLLGTLVAFSTLLPAFLYAKRARLSDPETGSVLACAFFSNLGYMGGFVAFALFGEIGYGLCVLYFVFFNPCFYTLGFWLGARYGGIKRGEHSGPVLKDEVRFYPFIGMLVGLLLNLLGVPRPLPLEWLNHVLIPLDTVLYLTAIGSQLTFPATFLGGSAEFGGGASPLPWWRPCLVMSGIKFLYTPLVAWALLTVFQLHGLPRMIVLLEASTPVGVSPLVLPLLFGLDRKLTHALWFWTTLVAVPWFLLLIPLLSRL